MGGEHHGILGILDDVDLFTAQFANDGLHAHPLHPDAGTHAIHIAVAALHGDLGALPGFARTSPDLHGAIVDLRHLLLEQAHHQFRRSARNQHTWTFAGFIHQLDHTPDAIAHAVALEP